MNLVTQHCHGYANGCSCTNCQARSHGVASGDLVYGKSGELRFKAMPHLTNYRALAAYMRELERRRRMQGIAA